MEFRVLGPLEVRNDAGVIALGGPLPRALLAMLLLHANQPVSVERLTGALWGEDAPAGSGRTLQVYVSRLRTALGERERLVISPAGYLLRVRGDELDAERFERQVAEGLGALAAEQLERAASELRGALSLWRGPALAELASVWLAPVEVTRLEERRLVALEASIEAALGLGRHAELVAELQAHIAEHPWRERLHAQLMLALYRAGRQTEALEAYRHARELLVEQLGLEPSRELSELQAAILTHDGSLDAARVTVASLPDGRGALPMPPTPLFGREQDLERLQAFIRARSSRLVTLIGPGGVGKTRVAIEAARRLTDAFSDGALFVDLASVMQVDDLASAIARSLGAPVREDESPTAALSRFLSERHLLLVLDNFEQLTAGAPVVAELLTACPDLTILLTSREPTRLAAERLHPVQPLAVPEARGPASAREIGRYGAVAMFLDRARARDPGFVLDDVTSPHVRDICRRLDGLPLALELAAARVGLLSPGDLAARLDQSLRVLTGGSSDAPERHRTLRATIDWSYSLLTPAERRAFAHMAAFAGGATVTAAETVTGASLDTLDALVAQQLLVRRSDRLLMLETVRAYALERLAEDPESEVVHARLGAWSVDVAREGIPHLARADRVRWLARLDAELPNALAALSWALEHGRAELALALAGWWGPYWWRTHRPGEGTQWIDAALDLADQASPGTRARALLSRNQLAGFGTDEHYRHDLQASLELFRAADDASGIAVCLARLALAEAWLGHFELAGELREDATRFAARSQDADTLGNVLTTTVLAGDTSDEIQRRASVALSHLRRTGHLQGIASVCMNTGYQALAERRYRDALTWLEEGVEAAQRIEDSRTVFLIRGNQALATLFLDDPDQATQWFCDALAIYREAAAEDILDEHLLGLASAAAQRGEFVRAARLAGAAQSLQNVETGTIEETIWSRLEDEILTPARHRHGPRNWDRAAREGARLSIHEMIDLALARGRFAPIAPATHDDPCPMPSDLEGIDELPSTGP